MNPLSLELFESFNFTIITGQELLDGNYFLPELMWIIELSPNWWSNEKRKSYFKIEIGIEKSNAALSYF